MKQTSPDRIRGSIVAGAVGDALGNPVEFSSLSSILNHYGRDGITRYDLCPHCTDAAGKAVFTDDTQMTLFTAEGLLNARCQRCEPLAAIAEAYLEWYGTQTGMKRDSNHECVLRDVSALNVRRAPGNTCLSALGSMWHGQEPVNNSKGCGGVMRIAPIALDAAMGRATVEQAMHLAADASRLTHRHPLGYLPSAMMADVIYHLAHDDAPTRERMVACIDEACERLLGAFADERRDAEVMCHLARRAATLAMGTAPDHSNIATLGEGWTGEEALAIALYCVVRHFGDLEATLVAAVNHSGDSDSTGAIAGNIAGAAAGFAAIPKHYVDGIEQLPLLLAVADALAGNTALSLPCNL